MATKQTSGERAPSSICNVPLDATNKEACQQDTADLPSAKTASSRPEQPARVQSASENNSGLQSPRQDVEKENFESPRGVLSDTQSLLKIPNNDYHTAALGASGFLNQGDSEASDDEVPIIVIRADS
jgi:hypothetical protein